MYIPKDERSKLDVKDPRMCFWVMVLMSLATSYMISLRTKLSEAEMLQLWKSKPP